MSQNNNKPKIMVQNISCILPQQLLLGGLYLGNVYGAQNPAILKQYGVRAVLTSSIETDISFAVKDIPFHLKIQAHDKQNYNLMEHINQCIHFIQQSRKLTNVFVHCFAGVSRSVAIVCAYIMWKLKWNYETTIAFLKAKRVVSKPNDGFVKQLIQIQSILLQTSYQNRKPIDKPQIQKINSTIKEISSYENRPQVTNKLLQKKSLPLNGFNQDINNNWIPSKPKQIQTFNQNMSSKLIDSGGNHLKNHNIEIKDQRAHGSTPIIHQQIQAQNRPKSSIYRQNVKPTNLNTTQSKFYNTQKSINLKNTVHQNQQFYNKEQTKIQQNNWSDKNQGSIFINQNSKIENNILNGIRHDLYLKPAVLTYNYSTNNVEINYGQGLSQGATYNINEPVVLGGRKSSYNHNNIPIPKVSERGLSTKQSKNIGKMEETNINLKAQPLSNSNYYSKDRPYNLVSPIKTNQFTHQSKYSLSGPMSPKMDNIYLNKQQSKNYNGLQNFYSPKNQINKEGQKSNSRLLVKPKDLPGYKNY